jgi:hypothetical protein
MENQVEVGLTPISFCLSGDDVGIEAGEGGFALTQVNELHKRWMKKKDYRDAYEALAPEYELARAMIRARVKAGLTKEQLAQRMKTTFEPLSRPGGLRRDRGRRPNAIRPPVNNRPH